MLSLVPGCQAKQDPPGNSLSINGQVLYITRYEEPQADRLTELWEDKQLRVWSKGPSCKLSSPISLNNSSAALIVGCGLLQQGRGQKGCRGACRKMPGGILHKTLPNLLLAPGSPTFYHLPLRCRMSLEVNKVLYPKFLQVSLTTLFQAGTCT